MSKQFLYYMGVKFCPAFFNEEALAETKQYIVWSRRCLYWTVFEKSGDGECHNKQDISSKESSGGCATTIIRLDKMFSKSSRVHLIFRQVRIIANKKEIKAKERLTHHRDHVEVLMGNAPRWTLFNEFWHFIYEFLRKQSFVKTWDAAIPF